MNEEYFQGSGCGLREVLFYNLLSWNTIYFGAKVLRACRTNLERPKEFMGTKIYRNYSEIYIRPLKNSSINCRLLRVGSIVSRLFWHATSDLQFADLLEGM
jgi:hypothetical protein